MTLVRGSLLYNLWASTFWFTLQKRPNTTTSCAVWRRILAIPILWPVEAVALLICAVLFVAVLGIGSVILIIGWGFWLTVGKRPCSWKSVFTDFLVSSQFNRDRYRGLIIGGFELYPWHVLAAAVLGWFVWVDAQSMVAPWEIRQHLHLQIGFWTSIVVYAAAILLGIILGIYRVITSNNQAMREWWQSLKGHFCAPVKVIDQPL